MDGVHDLGGIAGFGSVEREADEPVFHHEWERAVFRINAAAILAGMMNGGEFRHSVERMDPAHYLAASYYEHWLTGVATRLVDAGMVEPADLDRRAGGHFALARPDRGVAPDPEAPDLTTPRFALGNRVQVREWHPLGHTRAPRYVQGKRGEVVRLDGAFSVPDVEAHSDRRRVEPTYSVRFTSRELWGDGGADDEVFHVDLWEGYLEPAP